MKKFSAVLFVLILFASSALTASAYSQYDIYTAIEKSFDWIEESAPPLKTPDSAASDYSVMAFSEMNRPFDYNKYLSFTESRNPSTDKDGQRLIMTETACGSSVSDSFVRMYTYNRMRDNASDLSGAIITLDCGGYQFKNSEYDMDYLVMTLLTMQQADGSFAGDVYTTARSVIALAPYRNRQYNVEGTNNNEKYTYSVEGGIQNAVSYLKSAQRADFGYGTITNTAYVIIALDSVGINVETDSSLASGSSSPVGWIMEQQSADGSFNSSPDDTALSACALISHLRALQGKSRFFDFTSGDTVNSVTSPTQGSSGFGSSDTASPRSSGSDSKEKAQDKDSKSSGTEKAVVRITPKPTKSPEHSEMDEEEYGPFPPMGPIKPDKTDPPEPVMRNTEKEDKVTDGAAAAIIIVVILALIGGALLFIRFKYPEKLKTLSDIPFKKPEGGEPKNKDEKETDLLSDIDKDDPIVPVDELYDPDFVKTLIPVDHLDDSIGTIVADAADNDPSKE